MSLRSQTRWQTRMSAPPTLRGMVAEVVTHPRAYLVSSAILHSPFSAFSASAVIAGDSGVADGAAFFFAGREILAAFLA